MRYLVLSIIYLLAACNPVAPPAAVGPTPSERQLAWHPLEYYGFIHFNMNTFTDMEWGTGGESPEQFNPTQLDTDQWAKVAREAGMKGLIITAKHHDGFCLWPTETTGHSVKNSPWKGGEGDLIRDLAESCKANGLQFGVYLSPWDRNHPDYGRPEYVGIFHEQLRELLTNYGDIFEVWFDGANGGSGYYGGANETRKIDNKTYYQWDKAVAMVRELQPRAVIFSDGGPDIRWVGNEEGWANETNWSIMRRDEIYPGWPRYKELRSGHEDGTHWLPAEADVSIRPGWYYHPREDHQVKTLPQLLDIYYWSVGRNASLLLNIPVDDRGLVHGNDAAQLMALRKQLDKDFSENLVRGRPIKATDVRDDDAAFRPENAIDGNTDTYWATNDSVTQASLLITFDKPTEINRLVLQEYIPLGQRVQHFIVEAEVDGVWHEIDGQTTIGYKRILRFEPIVAHQLRINFVASKGPLTISNLEVYRAPNLLVPPTLIRNQDGTLRMEVPDKGIDIHYTLDGSEPTEASEIYKGPLETQGKIHVGALARDSKTGERTPPVFKRFDIPKREWKVVGVSSGLLGKAEALIDEDPNTFWATEKEVREPQEVIIDLGKEYRLTGFTYTPIQERYPFGIVTHYEFSVSTNGRLWKTVGEGEFGNVVNNRIEQQVRFDAAPGRFVKLRATKVDGDDMQASFAEIGVLTSP